ncbi:hypothetical protein ACTWQB_12420 [Piscibacillus sp. B03]|uniref:hypothetical protein n=1 Tax=Piscibacillus sp. B03 TaxID=3457430 RepID=UPI003FCC9FF3
MTIEWLREIGFGILWLFAQPMLYLAILFTFWTGYIRIKKERSMFRHRVFPIGSEWTSTWLLGISYGLLLSVLLVMSGSMLTMEWLWLLTLVVAIVFLTNQVWLLSPVYTVGIVAITMWILNTFNVQMSGRLNEFVEVDLVLVSYILVALFAAEILLLLTSKRHLSFPELHKSQRGKSVGSHLVKRLLFVPAFVPVPSGALELSMFNWWPAFGLNEQFGLMLFPFVIGFSQRFRGHFSDIGARKVAKALSGLLVVLLIGSFGIYLFPQFTIYLVLIALVGRIVIQYGMYFIDREKQPIFTPKEDGIVIVGIMPNSPADEMGLVVGEKIEKIHDQPISNEQEFYEAMSEHRTFCKMAVQDLSGEVRFVQRALYEGEYHELGLIFVKETPKFTLRQEEIS